MTTAVDQSRVLVVDDEPWTSEALRHLLHVFMRQLRKKLEENPSRPRHLLTEPWIGYRFNPILRNDTERAGIQYAKGL